MRKGHTPMDHVNHKNPCGCSTREETDFSICKCGAAYTFYVLSFLIFKCYDCGRIRNNRWSKP